MLKEELVAIMSDVIEEVNRRHAISNNLNMQEYEDGLVWSRAGLDYNNEMIVEELVRRGIIELED
jgi:hypothetical protein